MLLALILSISSWAANIEDYPDSQIVEVCIDMNRMRTNALACVAYGRTNLAPYKVLFAESEPKLVSAEGLLKLRLEAKAIVDAALARNQNSLAVLQEELREQELPATNLEALFPGGPVIEEIPSLVERPRAPWPVARGGSASLRQQTSAWLKENDTIASEQGSLAEETSQLRLKRDKIRADYDHGKKGIELWRNQLEQCTIPCTSG